MNSIGFPKMFTSSNTVTKKDYDATEQNTFLLCKTEKGEFVSDPFFGIRLKKYTFEQNNYILMDILVDELYSQIKQFMPQLIVNRKDIKIKQQGNRLVATFKAINKLDFVTNLYSIKLLQNEE